jgi:formylglycine-generating enzyme required for sulfatase activity
MEDLGINWVFIPEEFEIDSFWMMETPVTQRMWRKAAIFYNREYPNLEGLPVHPSKHSYRGFLPVESITKRQMLIFADVVGREVDSPVCLPTEAQWEYACFLGDGKTHKVSFHAHEANAVYQYSRISKPTPVRRYPANQIGLFDMHGNVGELVEWTDSRSSKNHLVKGGHYNASHKQASFGSRRVIDPDKGLPNVGFRLVTKSDPYKNTDEETLQWITGLHPQ